MQKEVDNSTHPVIFGIGTVECIVAVIKRELVRSGAAQHMLQLQHLKKTFGLGKQARRRKGEKKGERRLFLIPVFCRACGESSQRRRQESEPSFLQPRKEGRVSASV